MHISTENPEAEIQMSSPSTLQRTLWVWYSHMAMVFQSGCKTSSSWMTDALQYTCSALGTRTTVEDACIVGFASLCSFGGAGGLIPGGGPANKNSDCHSRILCFTGQDLTLGTYRHAHSFASTHFCFLCKVYNQNSTLKGQLKRVMSSVGGLKSNVIWTFWLE